MGKLAGLTDHELITHAAAWATEQNYPFAVFRMPGEKGFRLVIGTSLQTVENDELGNLGRGFLISGYTGDHYFIKATWEISSNSVDAKSTSNSVFPESLIDYEAENWIPYVLPNTVEETTEAEYINQVNNCISEINSSALIKVVPSRTKRIKIPGKKPLSATFVALIERYPDAFVSLISTPALGTWIGATPESLIEVNRDGIFRTMSLAGTQPYDGIQALHTLPWTQKEIEEQAMVSRYIINRFKEIRLREFEEVGPRTVSAGNMAHLCSTFTVDTEATDFQNLGSVMLKLLHPTSAICGMPKENAEMLLRKIEKHDRRLFSGYIGPVNMEFGSYIYVNLRCMEYQGDEAILYAGAGVTAYSVAKEEWLETELKCNTILNIINQ